jgi:hypothetical protein
LIHSFGFLRGLVTDLYCLTVAFIKVVHVLGGIYM